MLPETIPDAISIYIDKFEFVEAKKYLALKGPLRCEIVHDSMYPFLRYGQAFIIEKPSQPMRAGHLICYWHQDIVHPCLIEEVYPDKTFKVSFFNKESPTRVFRQEDFLGRITYPKLSLLKRIQFKIKNLRSALSSP